MGLRKLPWKLLQGAGVLWGAWTLVFFIFAFVPDPARQMAGQNERQEVVDAFRARHGLDRPVLERYARFWVELSPVRWDAARGLHTTAPSLGRSFVTDRSVLVSISEALPATLFLAVAAMGFALVIGIALGAWLAPRAGSRVDGWLLTLASLGMSAPSFVMALLVSWLLGSVLHRWTGLPMTGGLMEVDPFEGPRYAWRQAVLPALTLGIRPVSVVTQLTRNAVIDVLGATYIRTARSKGLSSNRLFFKHVLRNALNPVLTAASGWFASMLAGAVFIEFVFGWQGMGLLMFRALEVGDLPVVMGCVAVIALVFVAVNLVVDVIYGVLDPRVRTA
jgi:peptide/nickel transport system permease protein